MGWGRDNDEREFLHPDCCDHAKCYIYAWYDDSVNTDDREELESHIPKWFIRATCNRPYEDSIFPRRKAITPQCPWCGTRLPDFKLNDELPEDVKIMKGENGYYCETCEDRLQECRCWLPIVIWDIA